MIKNYCLSRKGRMKTPPGTLIIPPKEPAGGSNLMVDCLIRLSNMVDCLTGRFYYNKKSPVWVGNTSDIFIIF